MRRKRLAPDDPREWLSRARSNLARAAHGPHLPEVYLEDLCFDAQQAAEKAIRATSPSDQSGCNARSWASSVRRASTNMSLAIRPRSAGVNLRSTCNTLLSGRSVS